VGNIGIVGMGKMGQAIALGMAGKGFDMRALSRRETCLAGTKQVISYADLADCDAVILCVKPKDLADASAGLFKAIQAARTHPLVISVAAGKRIAFLENCLPGERVVRAMPNLAAGVGKAVTCFSVGTLVTSNDIKLAEEIFNCFGSSVRLDEKSIDAASVLGGSGPAFFFYFAQKLEEAGVKSGLDAVTAGKLARSALVGAAGMAENSQEALANLIKKVATPGGFTLAALDSLDSSKIGDSIAVAVRLAKEKCVEIGEEKE